MFARFINITRLSTLALSVVVSSGCDPDGLTAEQYKAKVVSEGEVADGIQNENRVQDDVVAPESKTEGDVIESSLKIDPTDFIVDGKLDSEAYCIADAEVNATVQHCSSPNGDVKVSDQQGVKGDSCYLGWKGEWIRPANTHTLWKEYLCCAKTGCSPTGLTTTCRGGAFCG